MDHFPKYYLVYIYSILLIDSFCSKILLKQSCLVWFIPLAVLFLLLFFYFIIFTNMDGLEPYLRIHVYNVSHITV